jgi:hypothetical protein
MATDIRIGTNMADNKAGKILKNILSGKTPGRGAANPNFPYGEMINPVYSPSSGNGPIMDPGFNRPDYPKKLKRKVPKKFKPYPRPNN